MSEISFFDRNISNDAMYQDCIYLFHRDETLKCFRQFIHKTHGGFGEDVHCIMWDKIVHLLPDNFRFIEIGVYKGQVLALVAIAAKKYNKKCNITGISPLTDIGDKYSIYENVNYLECIHTLHNTFNLDFSEDQIIKGKSTDSHIKDQVKLLDKFDVIYIDGGHDYDTVVSDIQLAKQICNNDGYIVMDDASVFLEFKFNIFKGHEEVSLAVNEHLQNDRNFIEKKCVGHNRIFKKTNININI
jgi:hypothetical protein